MQLSHEFETHRETIVASILTTSRRSSETMGRKAVACAHHGLPPPLVRPLDDDIALESLP